MTAHATGPNNQPSHVGRVLDDGSTQLYTYTYDGFGHVIKAVDPLGRTISYLYAANGIDLLEVRQTRAGNNELLSRTTYNAQHLPLTMTDAAGQTTTYTYNARGQVLTTTNAKSETTTHAYDADGYLVTVDGPLPGTSDAVHTTYDPVGRTRTRTDESGYTLTLDYDALDHLTKITHPDGTASEYVFDNLDVVLIQDRAGRQSIMKYDAMRQLSKRTDPLGRVSRFQWCSCGDLSSLTDPMGRTTFWHKDVQGRLVSKQYGDGSKVKYSYENTTSRLRQVVDEKQQVTRFTWNRDSTLNSAVYTHTAIPTPGVRYSYDPNYRRVASMTDGTGTTRYSYHPIIAAPALGAGRLAGVDGPLAGDTITYGYDQLGRGVSTASNSVAATQTYDAAGRVTGEANALGSFSYAYDGPSSRIVTRSFPNGLAETRGYAGASGDLSLQRITYKAGAAPVSEFLYGRDPAADRITTWSQQTGTQPPQLHTFGYDDANQLLRATVSEAGAPVNTFAYSYDPADNRLTEQTGASHHTVSYNALNQISTSTAPASARTNEWDARDRLVAVTIGNQRTEFTYDGQSRLASLRRLTGGTQTSFRRFVWCGNQICEERDEAGAVTKRFFNSGVKIESGPNAGAYFYTRDHLGSIRELVDSSGSVRARYAYDPYGRRNLAGGDIEADFGFAGMFWSFEVSLSLTQYRSYDPGIGRWLSRDPLRDAELQEGPNLYAYVGNNPLNLIDPSGLCCEDLKAAGSADHQARKKRDDELTAHARHMCDLAADPQYNYTGFQNFQAQLCEEAWADRRKFVIEANAEIARRFKEYQECLKKPCKPPACPVLGGFGPDPRGKPPALPPNVRSFYD